MTTLLPEFREAIESDDLRKVKDLLEQDSTLASSEEYHPLYDAAIEGKFDLAKLLLKYGADVDIPAQRRNRWSCA